MESIQDVMKKAIDDQTFKQRHELLVQKVVNHSEIQAFIKQNQLSDDVIMASYAKFYEYLTEKERFEKTGESQNEGFEPNLIFTGTHVEVSYMPTLQFLASQEHRELAKRIQTFDMPKNIADHTLETIELTQERRELFVFLKNCVQHLKEKSSSKGAYIYGSFGVGKTHLIGALAGTLAKEGFSCYLAHVPSLVVELKAAIANNQVNEKLESIKKTPILMLDDIGGESLTNWVRDDIFMVILDYRMRENLPTFFTSNLSLTDLESHFMSTTQSEDERKAKRLMERVTFLAQPFELKGTNKRKVY